MQQAERVVESVDLSGGILLRLLPGDDFFPTVTGLLRERGMRRGAFLSAIGSVIDVKYRNLREDSTLLPVSEEMTLTGEVAGPFELLSLEGTFVPMGEDLRYNVHIMLGAEDGRVVGGHLFEATVFTTLEAIIVELGGSRVTKELSKSTGLPEFTLKSQGH